MKIDDERAAARLARAIISDVLLYGGQAEELNEGRALFMSRVIERLHPLFDQALADPTWSPGRDQQQAPQGPEQPSLRRQSVLPSTLRRSTLPAAPAEVPSFERAPHPADRRAGHGGSAWPVAFFAAAFIAILLAAVLLFLATRPSG